MTRSQHQQRLVFPLIHVAAWVGLLLLPWALLPQPPSVPANMGWWRAVAPLLRMALLFYLNYFVLIPRLLARRHGLAYLAAVAGLMLLLHAELVLSWLGVVEMPSLRPGITPASRRQFEAIILLVTGLVWMVSSGLRITGEWFANEQVRRQMHSDKLAAELSFLKSQVSPHFLFNTLNNIYSLAQMRSDDTPEAIMKLSQLMRYMLYEANDPRVALQQEVEYLHNYVDLQRLRLADDVAIDFVQQGSLAGQLIEPMLLIPFVENAFKHGISYQYRSAIRVEVAVAGGELRFQVQNRCFPGVAAAASDARDSGIGIQNVTQRLNLLYPNRHHLVIGEVENEFMVTLTLELQHAPVPVS